MRYEGSSEYRKIGYIKAKKSNLLVKAGLLMQGEWYDPSPGSRYDELMKSLKFGPIAEMERMAAKSTEHLSKPEDTAMTTSIYVSEDGKDLAIRTTAVSEHCFYDEIYKIMEKMPELSKRKIAIHLTEIACAYRGYKSSTVKRTEYTVGDYVIGTPVVSIEDDDTYAKILDFPPDFGETNEEKKANK